jgi:hypothetical protein
METSVALGFVLDEKAHLLVRIAELERELRELKESRKYVLYGPPNGLDKWDREHCAY